MTDKKLVVYDLNSGKLFWFESFVLLISSWILIAEHMHPAWAFCLAFLIFSLGIGLYKTRYGFALWTLISMAMWGSIAGGIAYAISKDGVWVLVAAMFVALIAFASHRMRRDVDKDVEVKGNVY